MSDSWLELIVDPNPWYAPAPLPAPVETERLVVRLYQRGDGPALFSAIDSHRQTLLPWMVWARTDHQDQADSIHYVEGARRKAAKRGCLDFPMTVVEKSTGEIVGGSGLHGIRPGLHEVEIGYWVRGDRQGQGYCTEATAGLISAALRPPGEGGWGLRRVIILNATDNLASRRVCEKLGLRLEQRSRLARYLGPVEAGAPGYVDMLGFAVLADEWDFEQGRAKPGIGWS